MQNVDYLASIAHVIYQAPELTGLDEQVLGQIEALRKELSFHLVSPRRWQLRLWLTST